MIEIFNFETDFFGLDKLHVIYDKTIGKIHIIATKFLGSNELVMIELDEKESKHTVKPLKVNNK